MSSKLQNPNIPTSSGPASPDVECHIMATKELGESHFKSQNGVSPIHQQALHNQKSGSNTAGASESIDGRQALGESARNQQSVEDAAIRSKNGKSESLGFDLASARKSLSAALDSVQNAKSSSLGQASQGNANPSSPNTSQSSSTDHPNVKTLDFESG
ncbi:MAG: hypothetical protein VYC82_08315 [Verrucomicrobiota bacterium]|nr:hypothetical protein [Verrucomicrobiota bacterium]